MTVRELITALEAIAAERGDATEVRTSRGDWGAWPTAAPTVQWRPAGDDLVNCTLETEAEAREYAVDVLDLPGDVVPVVLIE